MVGDKIKLGYFVATAELRIDDKVTAYQDIVIEETINVLSPFL
jgi:hypothetical protein